MVENDTIPGGKSRKQAGISYLWPFLLLFIPPSFWYIATSCGLLAVLVLAAINKSNQFVRFHSLQAAILQILVLIILGATYYSTIAQMRSEADWAREHHINGSAAGFVPLYYGFIFACAVVLIFGLLLLYLAVQAAKGRWPKLRTMV